MKIFLDNCVHIDARRLFPGHDVRHASQMGWAGLENGELLQAAAAQFDVFVTTDKNIRFQQNLTKLPLCVIELNSQDTRITALESFGPHLALALAAVSSHRFVSLRPDGAIESLAPR